MHLKVYFKFQNRALTVVYLKYLVSSFHDPKPFFALGGPVKKPMEDNIEFELRDLPGAALFYLCNCIQFLINITVTSMLMAENVSNMGACCFVSGRGFGGLRVPNGRITLSH